MALVSRIRQFHPASREGEADLQEAAPAPGTRRGRPKGSRSAQAPASYRGINKSCNTSLWPLDQRRGLDADRFLPSVQEIVVWLTSLDPYGKCLQPVVKLLDFSICHRSAWLLTQKMGALVKAREDEAIAQAFDNPADPVFPAAEVASPDMGVLMADGTCGRIDDDGDPQPDESAADDPDARTK